MARIVQTGDITPQTKLSDRDREYIYNGLDSCVTLEVLEECLELVDNTSGATYDFSRRLQGPILEMSLRGTKIDQALRQQVLLQTRREITQIERQLNTILEEGVGVKMSWRSNEQLKNLMYNVFQLKPIRKRNANGLMRPTVNRDALERLKFYMIAEPICNHILKLRELDKRRQLLETGIDQDGRLRTSYNIAGTNTGRLSSSASDFGTGTNTQNIDRKLRQIFIADPGMKLANIDLEQADARNVGAIIWNLFYATHGPEYAGAYLDMCESGDLHTRVCRMAWPNLAWPEDEALWRSIADDIAYRGDTYRDLAKKLGHGTNYYGTPRTMAIHAKTKTSIIEDFQRNYFSAFPSIGTFDKDLRLSESAAPENWHDSVRWQLIHGGYLTTTHFNRRRFFYGRKADPRTVRQAIAYEPQSMTADEIDTGILNIWGRNSIELLIQVHDNILFQFPEHLENEIIPWAIEALTVTLELSGGRQFAVPVEAKTGWNWGDCRMDKNGEVSDNPNGLIKWTGNDKRVRIPEQEVLSLKELIG